MKKTKTNLKLMAAIVACFAVCMMFLACPTQTSEKKSNLSIVNDIAFADAKGDTVRMAVNKLAYATFVVEFIPGNPWTKEPDWQCPKAILGAPVGDIPGELITLGHGGSIVVGFDVYITDGPGNDIIVFEVGPDVEATKVELSNDLINWIEVGIAPGATSGVDINGKIPPGGKYRYLRLTDLKTTKPGPWTGADIDAIAVVHPKKIDNDVCNSLSIQGDDTLIGGGVLLFVRDNSIPGDGTNNQVPVQLDCKNNRAVFTTIQGHSCMAYLLLYPDGVNNTSAGYGGGFLSVEFIATGNDSVTFYFNSQNVGLFVNGKGHESNNIWLVDFENPEARKKEREKKYLLYGGDGRVARFLVEKSIKTH